MIRRLIRIVFNVTRNTAETGKLFSGFMGFAFAAEIFQRDLEQYGFN